MKNEVPFYPKFQTKSHPGEACKVASVVLGTCQTAVDIALVKTAKEKIRMEYGLLNAVLLMRLSLRLCFFFHFQSNCVT
jgi:hypothetical protein